MTSVDSAVKVVSVAADAMTHVCQLCCVWLQVPYTYCGVTFMLYAGVELPSVNVHLLPSPKLEVKMTK